MGRIGTTPLRTWVGTRGSVGSAVGPGWLSGPRFDRHFIGTAAAIAILSGLLVAARPSLFLPILFLDLWLLGYHHVVSTYTRLCFDADSLRRRGWMIYVLLPAVCAVVTVIGVTFGIWLLATIYLYWQWFHYTRQSYGIAQAYRRAAATDGVSIMENERLGHLVFYLVPLWGILHRAHQAPETFLGLPVWHPPVPGVAVDIAAVCAMAGLAWWIASRVAAWRQGRLAVGHTCYVVSHFAVFYVGYVAIESIDAGWIALNIWHNAQYIAFVWLQNNRSFGGNRQTGGRGGAQAGSRFITWLSRRANVWAYLGVCLGISTAFYAGLHYSAAAAGIGMAVLMVIYQTINFHHYVVDALIWRRPRRVKVSDSG